VTKQHTAADLPRYPLMFHRDRYEPLPLESLTIDSCVASLAAPYCLSILFFTTTVRFIERQQADDSLAGRAIRAEDVLIFDHTRTAPLDGAVQLLADGDGYRARICVVLADGTVEFHAAAAGFPILTGARRIYGTLAAGVRATDGREVTG